MLMFSSLIHSPWVQGWGARRAGAKPEDPVSWDLYSPFTVCLLGRGHQKLPFFPAETGGQPTALSCRYVSSGSEGVRNQEQQLTGNCADGRCPDLRRHCAVVASLTVSGL